MVKVKKVWEKKIKNKQKEAVASREHRKKIWQRNQEVVTKAGVEHLKHKRNRSTR